MGTVRRRRDLLSHFKWLAHPGRPADRKLRLQVPFLDSVAILMYPSPRDRGEKGYIMTLIGGKRRMSERKDWLIVALSESPTGQLSPVQIQKAMFLFKEGAGSHFDQEQFYNFSAYHFGPFSPDIYYDLEALERRGLVQIERSDTGKRQAYTITAQGKAAAEQIKAEQHRASSYLGNLTRWVQRKSFPARDIYIVDGHNIEQIASLLTDDASSRNLL